MKEGLTVWISGEKQSFHMDRCKYRALEAHVANSSDPPPEQSPVPPVLAPPRGRGARSAGQKERRLQAFLAGQRRLLSTR